MARRNRKVGVLNVADAISSAFIQYGQQVNEVLDDALMEVGREATEDLKAVNGWSPKGNPTGAYSKDWVLDIVPDTRYSRRIVVHNEDHYRLTHLLENGHALKRGGRVYGKAPAYEHIYPINQKAQKHVLSAIERKVEELNK